MTNFAFTNRKQNMSESKKKRNSYADMGLMIAVSILIVMSIKCLLFEAGIESIIWIIAALSYCAISYKYDSDSPVVCHATTSLLAFSLLIIAAMVFIDRNAQPKMHAFEGAKVDTLAEEEFELIKEPEITKVIEDTTEVADTLDMEEIPEGVLEDGPENESDEVPATNTSTDEQQ